jgi:hypothetical protein
LYYTIPAICESKRGREEGPFPPPFPEGKGAGRLMGVTVFRGSVSVEEGLASPLQGRRERGFIVESRHADQKYRHESKSHQSKTPTRKRTPPRDDACRENPLAGSAGEEAGSPLSEATSY